MIAEGDTELPVADSLYSDTFPEMIGTGWLSYPFSQMFLAASDSPRTASSNSQKALGFSGLPKFRQSVSACGTAPTEATLRIASATALAPPQ